VAMLDGVPGVLRARGAHGPRDPAYAKARRARMLADSAPRGLLSRAPARAAWLAALEKVGVATQVLDLADSRLWAAQPTHNPDPHAVGLTSGHLAYVIYTSGSTGTPKGVMGEPRGLVAVSAAWEPLYALHKPLNPLQRGGFSLG
ncbi:hypothetical protein EWW49_36525, partial [Pseudomonas syringae]